MNKFIAFDCETGGIGLDTSLLTAHFVIMDDNFKHYTGENGLIEQLPLAVKPNEGKPYVVTGQGLEVNGINLNAHNKIAITESAAGGLLFELIKRHSDNGKNKLIPVGHNVHFDITHTSGIRGHAKGKLLSPENWEQFVSYRQVDTMGIARHEQVKGNLPADLSLSLGSLADYFGLKFEGGQHDAKADTIVTIDVWRKLLAL